MKTLHYVIIALCTAAAVGVTGYFVLGGGGEDYLNAIPQRASMVLKLDLADICKQTELLENKDFQKMLQDFKDETSSKSDKHLLEIYDDPSISGLDLRKPVYVVWKDDPLEPVIVAAVADEKKLRDYLDEFTYDRSLEFELDREDGNTIVTSEELGLAIVFNKAAVTAAPFNRGAKHGTVSRLTKLLGQESSDNDTMKSLIKSDAPLNLWIDIEKSVDMISEELSSYEKKQMRKILQEEMLQDCSALFTADVENDGRDLKVKLSFDGNDAIKDNLCQYLKVPDKKVFDLLPAGSTFAAAFSLNDIQDNFYCLDADIRNEIRETLQVDNLSIDDFKGDFAFAGKSLWPVSAVIAVESSENFQKMMAASSDPFDPDYESGLDTDYIDGYSCIYSKETDKEGGFSKSPLKPYFDGKLLALAMDVENSWPDLSDVLRREEGFGGSEFDIMDSLIGRLGIVALTVDPSAEVVFTASLASRGKNFMKEMTSVLLRGISDMMERDRAYEFPGYEEYVEEVATPAEDVPYL